MRSWWEVEDEAAEEVRTPPVAPRSPYLRARS
ncbi:hypothetical protein SSCG_03610 [Streptomyces clavuligerus]|nr:hypothetical protein SSCG_03610 [Streptomyces clavuligerus]